MIDHRDLGRTAVPALIAEVERLREALKPFTHYAVSSMYVDADAVNGYVIRLMWDGEGVCGNQPMFAHFEVARAALAIKGAR